MILPMMQYLRFVHTLVINWYFLVVFIGAGQLPQKRRELIGQFGDKRMSYKVFQRQPLFIIRGETLPGEVLEVLRQRFEEVNTVAVDFLNELFLAAASPGRFSMQNLVDNDSNRPDIVFNCIDVAVQSLRTHVERRTHVHGFFGVGPSALGEPEICDFDGFVLEEDVSRFEVAMEEAIFGNMDEPHQNLTYDRKCLLFREFFPLFEEIFEIAFVAELSDDVAIVSGTEDIVAFEYVGVVELLEGVDFALQHLLFRFALDGSDVDDLDGYLLLGLVVAAAVHHRAETASDHVLQPVGIVLDLFAQLVVSVGVLCVQHSNSIQLQNTFLNKFNPQQQITPTNQQPSSLQQSPNCSLRQQCRLGSTSYLQEPFEVINRSQ